MSETLAQANNLIRKYEAELEAMRKFIHKHGLEFELDKGKNMKGINKI